MPTAASATDSEPAEILRVPNSEWASGTSEGGRICDEYFMLRSLLQDFEEHFISLHGRRPTPVECAADASYNTLYRRYAAAKRSKLEAEKSGADARAPTCLSTVASSVEDDELRTSAHPMRGDSNSLWLLLLDGGAALGQKRPRADLEAAAYPSRLHTKHPTFETASTQTDVEFDVELPLPPALPYPVEGQSGFEAVAVKQPKASKDAFSSTGTTGGPPVGPPATAMALV